MGEAPDYLRQWFFEADGFENSTITSLSLQTERGASPKEPASQCLTIK
jgi:hypothetical protein